jgi:hypothetical protein
MDGISVVLHNLLILNLENYKKYHTCFGNDNNSLIVLTLEKILLLVFKIPFFIDKNFIVYSYDYPQDVDGLLSFEFINEIESYCIVDKTGKFFISSDLSKWSLLTSLPFKNNTVEFLQQYILCARWSPGESICACVSNYGKLFIITSDGTLMKITSLIPLPSLETKNSAFIPPVHTAHISWHSEKQSLAVSLIMHGKKHSVIIILDQKWRVVFSTVSYISFLFLFLFLFLLA